MKIIYLCPFSGRAGGVKVLCEHCRGLAARGHDCEWFGLAPYPDWFGPGVPYRQFPSTDAIGAALRSIEGPKSLVATWWETAFWVGPNLNHGDKGYYLIQDIDQLTYSGDDSGTSYKLGLSAITESDFIQRELHEKYGVESEQVGIGLDHRTFRPLPFIRERFRVLTPARTTSAGPGGLKGFDIALESLRALAAMEPHASVVTFGMEDAYPIDFMPHIHVKSPPDAGLRELYSQSGVFLSTSRREGFGLPMLEAMACGLPVVTTDAGGNMEFCRHLDTALVESSPFDLAQAIARVMNSESLAAELSEAGIKEAARYRWPVVLDRLEEIYGRT